MLNKIIIGCLLYITSSFGLSVEQTIHPLTALDNKNLIFNTHYRSYYNTILTKWFNNSNNKFNNYDILGFLG